MGGLDPVSCNRKPPQKVNLFGYWYWFELESGQNNDGRWDGSYKLEYRQ
jgi:hypothetical protein